MFLTSGGGFGGPQVIVLGGNGLMVPMPLQSDIPQQFASASQTSALIIALFSAGSVGLAAASLFTPWVLWQPTLEKPLAA